MADLLLELFSEEIPARMQTPASEALAAELNKLLAEARLTHGEIKRFATPRRIAFIVPDLPAAQPDIEIERKGPATNAPAAAIEGFLRATGLTKEQCEIRTVGKQECYFAVIKEQGKPTAEALAPLLSKLIAGYTWPKSMRWGAYEQAWVRPLQNICCLLDSAIVPVSFAHLTANNKTYGHRFMAPQEIALKSPAEYESVLEKAFVIADAAKRKQLIAEAMAESAAKLKLEVVEDTALLEEVTGLVEWPVVLQGRIGDEYMDLPPEVLRSEMRNHQKYFNLKSAGAVTAPDPTLRAEPCSEGRSASLASIAPEFLLVSNLVASDGGKAIVAGNERVLRARLADGRFYWDQDRKKPLQDWAKGLEHMVFHAKIGHMAYRVERIAILAMELSRYVPGAPEKEVHRAAHLCKADLVSGMVGEFPELQGVMGRYYALQQGEPQAIADAIRDHYLPLGPSSSCPTAPVSTVIALADKIDSLAGLFAIGEKPTGSKDPYALRRAALGVIRIILENKLRLPLHATFGHALANYINLETKTQDNSQTAAELQQFALERFRVMLRGEGIRHDVLAAILDAPDTSDLWRLQQRILALNAFLTEADASHLLAAYQRAANIVRIESGKAGVEPSGEPAESLFAQVEEHALLKALTQASQKIANALESEQDREAFAAAAQLREPLDAFFEKVIVNAEDSQTRHNRLCLLSKVVTELQKLADLSKIES